MTIIEQKSIVMFYAKDETKKCVAARLWLYVYGRRRAKERECLATGSSSLLVYFKILTYSVS